MFGDIGFFFDLLFFYLRGFSRSLDIQRDFLGRSFLWYRYTAPFIQDLFFFLFFYWSGFVTR